jgi:type IV pilus assembly protein PilW
MTLVEWMVSITISLILLAGLSALIAQQSSTQAELEKSSRQIENGRYAMQLLNEDIQLAGYYGEFSDVLPVPTTLPNSCATAVADLSAAMPFPVQGYDFPSTTTVRPSCIAAGNHVAGTDILVVRRVEPVTLTIAAAASAAGGQVYLQTGLTPSGQVFDKKMGVGTDAAGTSVFTLYNKDGTTLAALRKFLVHIYFVSPCSVMSGSACCSAADGGKPIPTLKMLELSASGNTTTMTLTPLVEGIENMQIDYGFDTTGDGAPDNYAKDAAAVADWADVMAVRLHLLARSNESSAGYQDTKTYSLGLEGSTTATNDNFKRRVFSQLIRVVNPSSRRDQ